MYYRVATLLKLTIEAMRKICTCKSKFKNYEYYVMLIILSSPVNNLLNMPKPTRLYAQDGYHSMDVDSPFEVIITPLELLFSLTSFLITLPIYFIYKY